MTAPCDHVVAMYSCADDTNLVNADEFRAHWKLERVCLEFARTRRKPVCPTVEEEVELSFLRFNFCPLCGLGVDWTEIQNAMAVDT